MMNMKKVKSGKNHLHKSSARVVIVDLSSTSDHLLTSFTDNLVQALTLFFPLHNSVSGPPKVQLFSLFVLGKSAKCLVPLQNSMNSKNILELTHELILIERKFSGGSHDFEDNLASILRECVADFQSSSVSFQKIHSHPSHIDICLFTNHQHQVIKKQVAKVINENNIDLIKKVQIVHVSKLINLEIQVSQQSAESEENEFKEIVDYIEELHFHNSLESFQQFFKSWLVDYLPDDVQLYIDFDLHKENGFSLKCDLCDVLVNPLNFLKGKMMMLETNLNVHNVLKAKSKQFSVWNTYNLKPKQLIKSSDVCESMLYGLPYLLKPSTCWKLEWDDLEKNQNNFIGVNAYLQKENLTLLLEQSKDGISSYFLLLPSSGGTMLIKSIAVGDIIMPYCPGLNSHNVSIPLDVDLQMRKIVVATYNPFSFTSGLYVSENKSTTCFSTGGFESKFCANKRKQELEEPEIISNVKKLVPSFSYQSLVKKNRCVLKPPSPNNRKFENKCVLQSQRSSSFPSQL
ncbi:meiosis 1 arrest protein isoform X1 [Hydra vulgaris]|uniref:meiosis 1 arrest protein isoform X1 n=1 Tax=Hydra vulgaris TaxID=6087 RepID=UPI001F5EC076|nr:meiosis 1 arrest protein-like isoform X2 [Hydra vulgaris]